MSHEPVLLCSNRLNGREGNPVDIGHPGRRATDSLILANVGFFVAQVLSHGRLLIWGMKVSFNGSHCPAFLTVPHQ